MSIADQKHNLRKELLDRRMQLSKENYLKKSSKIIAALKEEPEFKNARTVHCYVSLNERNEVNTLPLIQELVEGEKRLVVPVTNFKDGSLTHLYLEYYGDLKKNKWDVLEPRQGIEVQPKELGLVIVPMAGGDNQKNRIGYGKGFYDRFLSEVHCPTIGLLFEGCLVNKVPTEKFDVPLSKLITESQIIG